MITCKQMLFVNFLAFFVQSVKGNLCASTAADMRTRGSHLWLLWLGSKAFAPNFAVLALHPLSPLWGGAVVPSSGMVLAAGDTCACGNPTWRVPVWPRRCESV